MGEVDFLKPIDDYFVSDKCGLTACCELRAGARGRAEQGRAGRAGGAPGRDRQGLAPLFLQDSRA